MTDVSARIKEVVTIRSVCDKYGLEITRGGYICCPFHQEDTPSLKIYPQSNSYYCFGCGSGGDVISFVMHLFGLDFKGALSRLDEDFRLGVLAGPRPSSLAVNKRRHDQWKQRRDLEAFRHGYMSRCHEARAIRMLPKPPPDASRDDPLWGMYASLLGRLDYLDNCYFVETHWR